MQVGTVQSHCHPLVWRVEGEGGRGGEEERERGGRGGEEERRRGREGEEGERGRGRVGCLSVGLYNNLPNYQDSIKVKEFTF